MTIQSRVSRKSMLFLTLLAAAIGCLLCLAGRADARVYWALLGGFGGEGEIGRANLDGSGKDRHFIHGAVGPVAIAVDDRHVYWINADGGTIGRARLDGSKVDQDFIDGIGGFPRDLTVADGYIYWTIGETVQAPASIARAKLNGTGVDLDFIAFDQPADFSTPTEIEVQGGYIYWTNAYPVYTIARARVDGSELDQSFITGLKNPFGLAVTDSYLYWGNRGTHSISRASIDGTGTEIDFIPDTGRIGSIAADERFLYWPHDDDIIRARLNGSKVKTLIPHAPAYSVAVDGLGPR
ncbi:MAG TPA: hypothetical protein VID76_08325 [Solirubrobacterales bacterium]